MTIPLTPLDAVHWAPPQLSQAAGGCLDHPRVFTACGYALHPRYTGEPEHVTCPDCQLSLMIAVERVIDTAALQPLLTALPTFPGMEQVSITSLPGVLVLPKTKP